MSLHDEMTAFFAEYVDAFARSDVDVLAELWEPVGLFPSSTGNSSMDRETFRAHLSTLLEFYRRQGVVQPQADLLATTSLFDNVAEARVAYRMLGDDGQIVAAWEHFYLLRRSDRWRVTLTIADGEMAEWTARGAQF